MYLANETFRTVVSSTPLVAIDLVIENGADEFLVGRRINAPAQGFWFVPGGRVLKNETLDAAFLRLSEKELGESLIRGSAEFLGVFEHLYADSIFDSDVSTHYVVLAYMLRVSELNKLPMEQHNEYRWMSKELIVSAVDVHTNTKQYFF